MEQHETVVETRVQYIHPEDGDDPSVWTWGDDFFGDSPDSYVKALDSGYVDDTIIAWVESRVVLQHPWEPGEFPEEKTAPRLFYLVWCYECIEVISPTNAIPFDTDQERARWCAAHTENTGHASWRLMTDLI